MKKILFFVCCVVTALWNCCLPQRNGCWGHFLFLHEKLPTFLQQVLNSFFFMKFLAHATFYYEEIVYKKKVTSVLSMLLFGEPQLCAKLSVNFLYQLGCINHPFMRGWCHTPRRGTYWCCPFLEVSHKRFNLRILEMVRSLRFPSQNSSSTNLSSPERNLQ